MQCLIIGYGSIGKKHAQILKHLGHDVVLLTKQTINDFKVYQTIDMVLEKHHVDYVVVANETYLHYQSLCDLIRCRFDGTVLVEKPIFSKPEILPAHQMKHIFVAYNLRFCELLLDAKKMIEQDTLISFSTYVGHYLPAWRKDTDYRNCYSSKAEFGGGVLRDLSHELDYATWFCGECLEVTALGGHYSDLQINSDDIYSILMRCVSCPIVNLQINYLDRIKKRDIFIQTKKHTIYLDLIHGVMNIDGVRKQYDDVLNNTYIKQHEAILSQEFDHLCCYEKGFSVVNLIDKISHANEVKQWISLCE